MTTPTSAAASVFELFAVVAPGLEPVVEGELRALGHPEAKAEPGGVTFRGDLAACARANLWLRAATRVLVRLGSFDAPGRRELVSRAARIPWERFLAKDAAVQVHASAQKSRLYHTGLIAEALAEAMDRPVAKGEALPMVLVRLVRDRCTVSLDTSGELLHKRGYRQEISHAPLRETLAAGALLHCGYTGELPFLDPMCGSGTFPVEAALIARRRAPGIDRSFALEGFSSFDRKILERLREEARAGERTPPAPIFGSDVHAGALGAARRNAERARVLDDLKIERLDVARLTAPGPAGLLITNPPYGKRVGARDDSRSAEQALRSLTSALTGPFRTWHRAVLAPPSAVRAAFAQTPTRTTRLDNGGIPVELLEWAPEQQA